MDSNKNFWLGLETYSENDRLYGRDRETLELLEIIKYSVCSTIFGRTGVGKSSLLKAKIFPMLRYNDFFPVYIRLEHNDYPDYSKQVYNCIVETVSLWNDNEKYFRLDLSIDEKNDDICGLIESVKILEQPTHIRKIPVLIIDQFEEIFTIANQGHKENVERFFEQIALLLENSEKNNFRVLFCIREDYIYCMERISASIPSLKRNRYQLKALDYTQAHEVICSPSPGLVSDDIAEAIIGRLDADNTSEIDSAILSLFMHQLYEKGNGIITLENVNLYGDNIISEFYEEGMARISAAGRNFLEDRLVTGDGFRCHISYKDALDNGVTESDIDILKSRRIITGEELRKNHHVIELTHDILCPVVMKNRSERKLKAEAEILRNKAKATRRKLNILFIIFALVMLLSVLFAYLFFEIKKQRDGMYVSQTRFVVKEARELADKGFFLKAMALVSEVYPKDIDRPERPLVRDAYDLLRELNDSCRMVEKVLYGHTEGVNHADWLQDSSCIVTFSSDNHIKLWNGDGNCRHTIKISAYDKNSGQKRNIDKKYLWSEETGRKIALLKGLKLNNWEASVSPSGKIIATLTPDSTIVIRNTLRGDSICVLNDSTSNLTSVLFSPDERYILTVSGNYSIKLWDTEKYNLVAIMKGHQDKIISVEFSHDGDKIVSTSVDGTVRVWDCSKPGNSVILNNKYGRLPYAYFDNSGNNVIINQMSDTVKVWDISMSNITENVKQFYLQGGTVYNSEINSSGTSLIVASEDCKTRILNVIDGECKTILKGHSDRVLSACFGKDNRILTASADKTAVLWNLDKDFVKRNLLTIVIGDVWKYTLSPDGQKMAVVTNDNHIKIVDTDNGDCVLDLQRQESWVRTVDYSSDGKKIIVVLSDNNVKELDGVTGKCMKYYKASQEMPIRNINKKMVDGDSDIIYTTTSKDEKYTVKTKKNNIVELYDFKTGEKIRELGGHSNYVDYADFNDDCTLLVTASRDKTARVWDIETGECLSILRGHDRQLKSVDFINNGKKVITLSNDNTIRIWSIPDAQTLINTALEKLNGYSISLEEKHRYYLE